MRFSCIMATIVLCVGLLFAHQRAALAQPYQKVWAGPSQRGSGSYQKQHGYAPGATCQPPCYPPCELDQPKQGAPKGGAPYAPRAAVPGIAPGVFVSPPQSGEIEGPSRGFEIGDISLTLPELKLGLPRLRCVGIKRFSRDARMMTDRAAAPYVGNPYYAAAMAQSQSRAAYRDAEPPEKPRDAKENRGAVQKEGCALDDTTKGACQSDLESRIQRLEGCFEMQVQALRECVEELKALRATEAAYRIEPAYPPPPVPYHAAEARSDVRIRSPHPLPPTAQDTFGQEVAQMNYEVRVPAKAAPQSLLLRRLPPATQ